MTTRIRLAEESDLFGVCDLLFDFGKSSGQLWAIGIDDDAVLVQELKCVVEEMIGSDDSVIIVAEQDSELVGLIAGTVAGVWFQKTHPVVHELAWWVSKKSRSGLVGIRLFLAFEEWASLTGAKSIFMSSIEGGSTGTDKFLCKSGYFKSDSKYIKRF